MVRPAALDKMSEATIATLSPTTAPALQGQATAMDYVQLMKPRVMSLVIFTALAGLVAAPVAMNPIAAACAVLALALGSGAAGALLWGRPAVCAARASPGSALACGAPA